MTHYQVSPLSTNTHDKKIRSTIDLLLSSNSIEVSEPTVQLTECSPELDIVVNKQGGICTRCNTMFKSRTSLLNHIEKCFNSSYGRKKNKDNKDNKDNDGKDENEDKRPMKIKTNHPRLIIVPQ